MEKVYSNGQRFAIAVTLRGSVASSLRTSVTHSPITKCHNVTLRTETVLAKRTHLKLVHQKRNCGFVRRRTPVPNKASYKTIILWRITTYGVVKWITKPNQSQLRDGFRGSFANPKAQ